jgi:hypothetical protein
LPHLSVTDSGIAFDALPGILQCNLWDYDYGGAYRECYNESMGLCGEGRCLSIRPYRIPPSRFHALIHWNYGTEIVEEIDDAPLRTVRVIAIVETNKEDDAPSGTVRVICTVISSYDVSTRSSTVVVKTNLTLVDNSICAKQHDDDTAVRRMPRFNVASELETILHQWKLGISSAI